MTQNEPQPPTPHLAAINYTDSVVLTADRWARYKHRPGKPSPQSFHARTKNVCLLRDFGGRNALWRVACCIQ